MEFNNFFIIFLVCITFLLSSELTIINDKNILASIPDSETELTLNLEYISLFKFYNSNANINNISFIVDNVTRCKNLTKIRFYLRYFKIFIYIILSHN